MKSLLFFTAVLLISCDTPGKPKPWGMARAFADQCRANCQAMGLELVEVTVGNAQASDRCICRPAADGGAP